MTRFRRRLRIAAIALGLSALGVAAAAAEPSKAAREAYNSGDMAKAAALADSTGDRWTGGLAAFRTQRYADALAAFSAIAKDPAEAAGRRGAAAFWAARSAESAGRTAEVEALLKIAAKSTDGLYGLLARTRLGGDAALAASARKLPMPELAPDGGFTQDKALIYALVKTESRFNPQAQGGANLGLMQLSAATAARLGGKGSNLMNAGANLKLGQAYVGRLLDGVKGDLVRALAAYNMGPDAVRRATASLGSKTDTLLLMESLPGENVRVYVRKVLADYWGYRHAMKQETGALELAALAAPALGTATRE